jgi:hypothetical protein
MCDCPPPAHLLDVVVRVADDDGLFPLAGRVAGRRGGALGGAAAARGGFFGVVCLRGEADVGRAAAFTSQTAHTHTHKSSMHVTTPHNSHVEAVGLVTADAGLFFATGEAATAGAAGFALTYVDVRWDVASYASNTPAMQSPPHSTRSSSNAQHERVSAARTSLLCAPAALRPPSKPYTPQIRTFSSSSGLEAAGLAVPARHRKKQGSDLSTEHTQGLAGCSSCRSTMEVTS